MAYMNLFNITLLAAVFLFGVAHSQVETHAEKHGTTIAQIREMGLDEFQSRETEFRDVIAWHTSRYCKRVEKNCWSEDKQIRTHDVVIIEAQTSRANVDVTFYIRDRYDHERAGLQNKQVRRAIEAYTEDIHDDFKRSVVVIEPGKDGMATWKIATITVCCAVGVALIITIAVLGSRDQQDRKRRRIAKQMNNDELKQRYEEVVMAGKDNPGYDSDGENKPSSSSMASDSDNPSPPPGYDNSVATARQSDIADPEAMFDGATSGAYNLSQASEAGHTPINTEPINYYFENTKI